MNAFIQECKHMIDEENLDELQSLYEEYKYEPYAWDYAFQKIYLHACLKKKKPITEWLQTLFPSFDPIQQMALRQMFSYGRYLLAK